MDSHRKFGQICLFQIVPNTGYQANRGMVFFRNFFSLMIKFPYKQRNLLSHELCQQIPTAGNCEIAFAKLDQYYSTLCII